MAKISKVTKMWTQKDGTKIRICDMSDKHLINTINMLDRMTEISYERAIHNAYSALAFVQGEMATMAIESEIDRMEEDWDGEMERHPLYDDLVLDAKRRGLKLE